MNICLEYYCAMKASASALDGMAVWAPIFVTARAETAVANSAASLSDLPSDRATQMEPQ